MSDLPQLFDDLYRHRHARLLAGLARALGPGSLELAEDVLQEAMMRALKRWPFDGVPEHPVAWLATTARNIAFDSRRRQKLEAAHKDAVKAWAERAGKPDEQEVDDAQLRMVFACCHPALSPTSRVALTLSAVCGFGRDEVARALLISPDAAARRLSRAKAVLKAENVPFVRPEGGELRRRMTSVLDVLYLLFNEGYAAHEGDALVRHDLILEALRLCGMLLETEGADEPRTHALAALMLFLGARTPARVNSRGELTILAEQDRSAWRQDWLRHAWHHFERCARGGAETPFHIEAAIASHHAAAPSYEATDWNGILAAYDRLVVVSPTALTRLNRAVAVLKTHGAAAALAAIDEIEEDELQDYHLLPATRGLVLWIAGRHDEAATAFTKAEAEARTDAERTLMRERARQSAEGAPPPTI